MYKRVILVLGFSFLACMGGSSETGSEPRTACLERAQDRLMSCYQACDGVESMQECRASCRERYERQVGECLGK